MSIEETIKQTVNQAIEEALIPKNVEKIAFSQFQDRTVSIQFAAEFLGVHPDTVRSYVKYGLMKAEPRTTDRSPYKFNLAYLLSVKKEDLR